MQRARPCQWASRPSHDQRFNLPARRASPDSVDDAPTLRPTLDAGAQVSGPITTVWPGDPYPGGATWDGEGVNFALFSAHAEKRRAVPVRRHRPARDAAHRRCASTPTRSGTAICPRRGPACSTATACTAPTTPRTAIASTRTSCCSTPTRKRHRRQPALERRAFRLPRRRTRARTCRSTAATAPPACRSAG